MGARKESLRWWEVRLYSLSPVRSEASRTRSTCFRASHAWSLPSIPTAGFRARRPPGKPGSSDGPPSGSTLGRSLCPNSSEVSWTTYFPRVCGGRLYSLATVTKPTSLATGSLFGGGLDSVGRECPVILPKFRQILPNPDPYRVSRTAQNPHNVGKPANPLPVATRKPEVAGSNSTSKLTPLGRSSFEGVDIETAGFFRLLHAGLKTGTFQLQGYGLDAPSRVRLYQ